MGTMKKILWLSAAVLTVGVAALFLMRQPQPQTPAPVQSNEVSKEETMKIESSAFAANQSIPQQFTCDGENVNPPLKISGIPAGTKSLVLIVDDPDAPAGTWIHWLVWNIAPDTGQVEQNSVPAGAMEGTTSFGKPGYGGPCPPSGTHRYFFKLYALDTSLGLTNQTTVADLEAAMKGHVLEQAELVGRYGR